MKVRRPLRWACLVAVALGLAGSVMAAGGAPVALNIPAQPLADAINEFGRQSGLHIVVDAALAEGKTSAAVTGTFTPEAGLSRLLVNAGLRFEFLDAHTVAILPQTAPPPTARPAAVPTNDIVGDEQLQEITVTAQKRVERLEDVPVPVSAINTQNLAQNSQLRLMDYYTQVPGLIVSPADYSSQLVAIRGITTGSNSGAGTPTTGIMIDDVPFGNSTNNTPGFTVPDLDPGDLARVEVLRGPQGTLYGASSMGGLIKYVTVDPSPAQFGGRLEAGTNTVRNGSQPGYSARGSVNMPLSSDLAVRASVFTRLDAGYIDNPALGIDGINQDRAYGGHVAALWKPTQSFNLKFSALYQQIKGDGTSDTTTFENVSGASRALGALQQGYVRGAGPYERQVQAYGAIANYQLGAATLTSVTGYNVSNVHDSIDYTANLAFFAPDINNYFGVTAAGLPIAEHIVNSRFSEELRLATPLGSHLDSLVGLYYDHERAGPQQQNINVTHPTTGSAYGRFLAASFPSNYREYAVFADLTYRVTDRFDVQVGGREGWQRVAVDAISDTGPFNILVLGAPTADPLVTPSISSNDQAFTYLLTPRYKLSDDRMLYARFASGYRPGGPNTTPGEPPKYAPDKTQNYELGFKGEFLERTVAVDASLYYIKWTNIQLNLIDPLTTFGYTGNAGDAKSQGVELSGQWRPLSGLSVAAWVAYDDAVLTSWPAGAQAAYEAGTGPFAYSGARLPLSPRVSANFSLEQKFKLAAGLTASLGGAVSYVGDREGVFAFTPQRQYLPAYSKVDFTAALDWQQWHANLYVNNAFDRGGLISGGLGTDLPYSFYFMQPRLVGLSLAWQF